mmetsp:Transcript_30781/g.80617  ORF Transcript_30781/g.80617 Transcript_30781/m.80617 type:complete len:113 (-) Transcript_30781:383-721(-)
MHAFSSSCARLDFTYVTMLELRPHHPTSPHSRLPRPHLSTSVVQYARHVLTHAHIPGWAGMECGRYYAYIITIDAARQRPLPFLRFRVDKDGATHPPTYPSPFSHTNGRRRG